MTVRETKALAQEIAGIVAEVLEQPEGGISAETRAAEVEAWDSLGHVRIVLALEAAFGIRFTMGEIEKGTSIPELARLTREAQAREG
ncbi:acyl carrier protein [Mangrovicella endophytica]|uniref:acyl carrier protein n=1 Tax=Mangrovicella endophytica TaxID=2066697 RepID=UPI000C9E11FF|nr:acyl carrier protein [Mangrovicella endophytica]